VNKSVYAVVVSYNARDDTLDSIRSLCSLERLSGIIVVDNASADGTDVAVEKEFPGVELVRSPVNRGYGGGNNLGFARALALGADSVLVVNSDVEVTNPRFLEELVARLEADPAAGLAGPLVRLPDGSVQPTVERWPSVPLALRLALKRRLGRAQARKRAGRVPAVNGAVSWCGGRLSRRPEASTSGTSCTERRRTSRHARRPREATRSSCRSSRWFTGTRKARSEARARGRSASTSSASASIIAARSPES
jgi:GT2 family glycosyltransferase